MILKIHKKIKHDTGKSFAADFNLIAFGIQKEKAGCIAISSQGRQGSGEDPPTVPLRFFACTLLSLLLRSVNRALREWGLCLIPWELPGEPRRAPYSEFFWTKQGRVPCHLHSCSGSLSTQVFNFLEPNTFFPFLFWSDRHLPFSFKILIFK